MLTPELLQNDLGILYLLIYLLLLYAMLLNNRLVVGWSWEEVILALIDDAVSGKHGHPGYEWIKAFACIVIACVVLAVGWYIDVLVGVYRNKELEQLRESMSVVTATAVLGGDAPRVTELVMNPLVIKD